MAGLVVVDASLAFKWLVKEDYSHEAIALARSWDEAEVTPAAPYLMPVEVANALLRRVVRRELNVDTATRLIEILLASGIELSETSHLHQLALELAGRLRQEAVYDAHYLALSETLHCDLWTADERFYRAASPTYVNVHWIGEVPGA